MPDFRPTHPIRAVLFDWDDTLLNSYDARIQALQFAFDTAGIGQPTAEEFIPHMMGRELSGPLKELQAVKGSDADLVSLYRRHYWLEGGGHIQLLPGVEDLLNRLHASGIRLGVVTQKFRSCEIEGRSFGAITELRRLGIEGLFGAVVGSDDVAKPKPHPEGLHLALERLGARPDETLMVGDSAADVQAGLAAGCWSVHATWGLSSDHPGLNSVEPHLVAARPEAVLSAALSAAS